MKMTTVRTRQPPSPPMPRLSDWSTSTENDPFDSLYLLPQENEMFPVFPCDDLLFPKSFENDNKSLSVEDLEAQDVENIDDIAAIFESMTNQNEELSFKKPEDKKKRIQMQCINESHRMDEDVVIAANFEEEDLDEEGIDTILDSMVKSPQQPETKKNFDAKCAMARQMGISEATMLRMLRTKTTAHDTIVHPPASFIPVRTYLAPSAFAADIRCFEPTAFSQGHIDPRIPSIEVPKMDAQLRPQELLLTEVKSHDEKSCDICQSNKTPNRKAILHRWRIRRERRNWSKGPRYNGRSSVASNRARVNGRFIPTAR